MKNFARIEHGAVVELLRATTLPPFHPELRWIECVADVQVGWVYAGGALSEAETDPLARVMTERAWRDSELSRAIWLRDRHRDQLEINVGTTLNGEQFSTLLVYLQALRDWPQSPVFPDPSARPNVPQFIEQTGDHQ